MLMCGYQGSVSPLLSQQLYYAMAFGVLALYLLDCMMLHSYLMLALWGATWCVQTTDGAGATMIKYYILVYGGLTLVVYIIVMVMVLTTQTETLNNILRFMEFPIETRDGLNKMRVSLGRQAV